MFLSSKIKINKMYTMDYFIYIFFEDQNSNILTDF